MNGRPIGAFLALWNGVRDPKLVPEYEAWHTFEHVPERVGSPGFAWACRYAAAAGATGQPAYFTLYALDSLGALATPRYQELLDHPSDWSARMRGVLSDFRREPCEVLGLHGISLAARLVTLQVRIDDPTEASLSRRLADLVRSGAAVSALLGRVDRQSGHPLAGADTPRREVEGVDAVILLQHLHHEPLQALVPPLLATLGGEAALRSPPAHYEFQSLVRQCDLPHPLAVRQPPCHELRQTFHPQGDNA